MGQLLNLIGFSTGIALYAPVLAIVINTIDTSVASTRRGPLQRATAVRGRVWRLCSLAACEYQHVVSIGPVPPLTAAGERAVGVPAALVVHSVWGRQVTR
jgi:hypothetical protein